MDKLELCKVVVPVYSVFRGGLYLYAHQFVLEALILLLGQVLVEVTLASLVAAVECQEELGAGPVFLIYTPLAAVSRESTFVVKTERCTRVNVCCFHNVRIWQVYRGLQSFIAGSWPVTSLVSLVKV